MLKYLKNHFIKTISNEKGFWPLLWAILQNVGKAVLKGVATKAAGKAMSGGEESPDTNKNALVSAFASGIGGNKGAGGQQTANVQGMGNVPVAPADYYKGQGALANIPTQTNQPMQYVPGSQGSVLGGQGEVMPGYSMQSPQSRVPSAYLNMAQAGQQVGTQAPQKYDVGAVRGFINSLTGQPQPQGLQDVSQGRRTAYYAGGVIPNIVMSKLGQPSSAEATAQQQQIQSGQQLQDLRKEELAKGKVTPEYKADLQSAVSMISGQGVTDTEKSYMYQKLAAKYPERSAELKRIFFPQASDAWAETLGNIINQSYARQ